MTDPVFSESQYILSGSIWGLVSVSVSYFALPSDMETVDTLDGFRRTLVPERWAHPGEGRPETAGLVGGNPDAIVMYTN